jgi:hypothetical protein
MSMKQFVANVDRHIYDEGDRWVGPQGEKVGAMRYFAAKAEEAGIAPEDKELEKREQHYLRKFRVPVETMWEREEKIKAYARDSYAIEAIMTDLGVPPKGPDAATVGKAFTVSAVQAIFPIFYDTIVVAGLLAQPLLDRLVAMTTQVNSGTADHVVMNENSWDRATGEIGEWTRFPELAISASNAPVVLKKWGGILKASDEAIRRARLPIFQRGLERIGRQLANDLTDFAMDVLLLGDGNTGSTAATVPTVTTSSPSYFDLVATQINFPIGYQPTDLIATGTQWLKLLNFPEFKDPLAGFRFQGSGVPPTPLGMNLWRWDSLASSGWATSKVLMLEAERALAMYTEGGVSSESNRIVNGEWSSIKTSIYAAFAILDTNARRIGTGW